LHFFKKTSAMTKNRWLKVAAIAAAGLAGYVFQRRRSHPAQLAPGEKIKPGKKPKAEPAAATPKQAPKSWGTSDMITNE
jgi:hypothetical protein